MKKLFLLIFFISLCAVPYIHAQSDSSTAQTFDVAAATQKYLDTLSPAQKAKSDAYFEGGYWLILWDMLYTIGVGLIFLRLGLSRRIKGIATKVSNVNLQNLIYGVFYFLLTWILMLPISIYEGFYREHQYGLSNLTFSGWLSESLKGLGVELIMGSVLLVILYFAFRKTGRSWWVWGAAITILFSAFAIFITPVFLAPIFNQYKPLEAGPLKSEILSMARANNIPADNVYMFDASKQSDKISANVSGFASTTRISLNDNLLKRCTPAEIKSVMGHEMGHYVMNHIYKGLLAIGVIFFLMFALVGWAFDKIVAKWGGQLSISGIGDISGLPLLVILFSVTGFLATPLNNTITRTQEVEADMFGLNVAREPDGFANVAMKLSEYRKINPGYWEEIIFFDHPSGRVRVTNAMRWKAEHLDEKK